MLYPVRFLSSGRRVAVGLVVLLVAASGVAACGSNKASEGPTVPPLEGSSASADAGAEASDGSSAEASADAGASAAATGLTAESLSDPQIEYTMVSIPENLDPTQSEVLAAFVAHDQATWKAVRDMNGTTQVEATTTGQELTDFMKVYKDREAKGQHVEGPGSTEISSVYLMPDDFTASVDICNDQTQEKIVSASGEDQTPENVLHRFPMTYTLVRSGSGWKVASSSQGATDQC